MNFGFEEWKDYYKEFPYFSHDLIRPGCYPLKAEPPSTDKSIVLVHGLTDSPHYLESIANQFFIKGYNVYVPLLQCHGLKDPKGMEYVSHEIWKKNVNYTVDIARAKSKFISIGGLSTGGALSFYTAETNENVSGALYLFSAALDLYSKSALFGEVTEKLVRTDIVDVIEAAQEILKINNPLIGGNPFRYSHVDLDGARALALLIKETDKLKEQYNDTNKRSRRTFAAHSESDKTASITGIEDLEKISTKESFWFYRIREELNVSHASVVLEKDIIFKKNDCDVDVEVYGPDEDENNAKESKNDHFSVLISELNRFIDQVPA